MKVTVCELSDNPVDFKRDWKELENHLISQDPDLLLVPEMPFSKWLAFEQFPNEALKRESVNNHQNWLKEIEKLHSKNIIYSAPEMIDDQFFNTAFIFSKTTGHVPIHRKAYFPQEPNFWESTWFDREQVVSFNAFEIANYKIGLLICTELWFLQHAREYGKNGVDLLLCPRATGKEDNSNWINCGKIAAIVSGAYCLSSNRSGVSESGFEWGGGGWVTAPINGELLGSSSSENKIITVNIDLRKSRAAKLEYPLYVDSKF